MNRSGPKKVKRRWYQFSLRTLVICLCCLGRPRERSQKSIVWQTGRRDKLMC